MAGYNHTPPPRAAVLPVMRLVPVIVSVPKPTSFLPEGQNQTPPPHLAVLPATTLESLRVMDPPGQTTTPPPL